MTYPDAIKYLESLINYEKRDNYDYNKSFKLGRMKELASLLGDPQKDIKSAHVAGSKGKGSTCAFIHSILKNAGFKAGLYTSPHLTSFRERIRIGDDLISESDVIGILDTVKGAAEKLGGDAPSFFEVSTAISYLYFKEKRVDAAVYETGLGGRLDATNILTPLATAITPISLEHTTLLGNTLGDIAREKAGIIKAGVVCISAPQGRDALEVIEGSCAERSAKFLLAGRDILFETVSFNDAEWRFSVTTGSGEYPGLKTGLLGGHQVVNAAVAIGAVEALRPHGFEISPDAVRRGIEAARWPGRLEMVGRSPYVILDGAQNASSSDASAAAVKKIFKYKRLILILGVSKDKDIKGILKALLPISDSVILTKSKVAERALEPAEMVSLIPKDKEAFIATGAEAALGHARSKAGPDDLILVTGSLFLVGEAREILVKSEECQGKG